ncbi:hypothetical protein D3C80_1513620 [compost metagenome]
MCHLAATLHKAADRHDFWPHRAIGYRHRGQLLGGGRTDGFLLRGAPVLIHRIRIGKDHQVIGIQGFGQ